MRAVTLLIALPAALHAFRAPTPLLRPNIAVAATPVSELLAGEVAVGDASMTRAAVVADLATRAETPAAFSGDAVDWAGWRAIDEVERAAGEMYDAPRAKLDDVGAMREVARRWGGGGVV